MIAKTLKIVIEAATVSLNAWPRPEGEDDCVVSDYSGERWEKLLEALGVNRFQSGQLLKDKIKDEGAWTWTDISTKDPKRRTEERRHPSTGFIHRPSRLSRFIKAAAVVIVKVGIFCIAAKFALPNLASVIFA